MSCHVELRDWAVSKMVHPTAYTYLAMYGSVSKTGFVYTGPKGWETISDALRRDDLSANDLRDGLVKSLGTFGANHFLRFVKLCGQMPDWDEILSGANQRVPDLFRLDSASGVVLRKTLAAKLKEQFHNIKNATNSSYLDTDAFAIWCRSLNNALQFVDDNLQPRQVIMFLCDAINTYGPPIMNARSVTEADGELKLLTTPTSRDTNVCDTL